MKNQKKSILSIFIIVLIFIGLGVDAQQWIQSMPGYERYKEVSPQMRNSVKSGQVSVKWADDGKSFTYNTDGKKYQFDIKKKKAVEIGEGEKEESPMNRYRRMYADRPERGDNIQLSILPMEKARRFTSMEMCF